MTVLSVAPGLLIMVTSFTRFIVALSFLRSGLGLQSAPANLVLISLSLFMTFFVMAPTFDRAWQNGLKPLMDNKISQQDALAAVIEPFREFMLSQVREKDIALFEETVQRALRCHGPLEGGFEAPYPGLHDLRAPSRLRDRVSHRVAVSGHRHDRRDADDVDGHDDAAAFGHLAAGQDPVFRSDRRLESADRQPRAFGKLIERGEQAAPASRKAARLKWTIPRGDSMSILNTSVSGMQANSNWLSTISQNVANANTTGYKNVETDFSSSGRSDRQRRPAISAASPRARSRSTRSRAMSSRPRPTTDLAVQGAGFFVVSDSSGTLYLTRNGSFTPDASGNLVNSAGYYLMAANVQNGVSPLAANSLTGLQKVNVVNAGQTATATTTGSLTANLPSTATPVAAANLPSANSASSTYTEATSLVVYDNLGGSHTINLYFTNTGSNTWEVDAYRCVECVRKRRFSLFVRPAGDADPHLQPDDRRVVLGVAAFVHGAERPDDEPRSQQHDAACGGLQRDCGDGERERAERHQRRLHLDQRILDIQLCKRDLERRL